MQAPPNTLDFGSPFAFLFRQPGGRQALALGGLLMLGFPLLFIPPLVALGWGVELGRRVSKGDQAIPGFGFDQLADGLRVAAVLFLYAIPMFAFMVPFFAASLALAATERATGFSALAIPWVAASFVVSQLYGIFLATIAPALLAVLIADGSIGLCFSPSRIGEAILPRGWGYLGVVAVIYGVGQGAGLGMILCFIGIFWTTFYGWAATFHYCGQLATPLVHGRPVS